MSETARKQLWRVPKFKRLMQPETLKQLRSMPIRYLNIHEFDVDPTGEVEALEEELELLPDAGLLLVKPPRKDEAVCSSFELEDLEILSSFLTRIDTYIMDCCIFRSHELSVDVSKFCKLSFPKLEQLVLNGYGSLKLEHLKKLSKFPIVQVNSHSLDKDDLSLTVAYLNEIATLKKIVVDMTVYTLTPTQIQLF